MIHHPIPTCVHQDLVVPCLSAAGRPALALGDLRALAESITLDAEQREALRTPDPSRPYGRRVIFANDVLEVMVATWTRGVPCSPHDHGGSVGAVKVLQGRSRHEVWGIDGGALVSKAVHAAHPGDVLACGPDLIHSMGDDGAELPLMTLHLYTTSIDFMVVYEPHLDATHVVSGDCGAWVPHGDPQLLRRSLPGIRARRDL